jgi:ATP-dependent Zn protease
MGWTTAARSNPTGSPNFLSNWILPLVFFVLLWRFLARRMGKGVGFLDVGKNKARIYAVDDSQKVTFKTWPVWTKPSRRSKRWSHF